jgi:hypothetical protein
MRVMAAAWRKGVLSCLLGCGLVIAGSRAVAQLPACTDATCIEAAIAGSPVRTLGFWQHDLGRPLGERIEIAPAALVDYINLDNIRSGFPNRALPSTADAGFVLELQGVLKGLPAPVLRHLEHRLAGIYLADNIGGTGYTDIISDGEGRPAAGFIVLDPTALARTANEWATWKESSPFIAVPGWALQASIEEGAGDSRRNAMEYILLHEIGHVLSIGSPLTPSWNLSPYAVRARAYPFFHLSWQVLPDGSGYSTYYDNGFVRRKDLSYYVGARIPVSEAGAVYGDLWRTNFPTLYAATNPADDFAESFVNYVHVVMLKKPFVIVVSHDGRVVRRYGPCWAEARCQRKRAFVEHLLGVN